MVVADPDEALIEAIAEAISDVYAEDQRPVLEPDRQLARAAYAAMVEHLGLVEETCCDDAYRDREEFGKYSVYTCADMERSCLTRLAQPWPDRMEVDHGSE